MSTKIRLHWRTIVDPKHLRDGIHLRIIRLFAPASFREAEGWSIPYNAIVDLGSPFTILPKTKEQSVFADHLTQTGSLRYGIILTSCESTTSVAPRTITFSPPCKPAFTAMEFPTTLPKVIFLSRAMALLFDSSTTKTA